MQRIIHIEIPDVASEDRRVKTCAIKLFRCVRFAGAKAASLPVVLREATRDVQEAWHESAER